MNDKQNSSPGCTGFCVVLLSFFVTVEPGWARLTISDVSQAEIVGVRAARTPVFRAVPGPRWAVVTFRADGVVVDDDG